METSIYREVMELMTFVLLVAVLLIAGSMPWWFAGRHTVARAERTPVRELGVKGVVATLRRGASVFALPN